jgi:hypothetical protein
MFQIQLHKESEKATFFSKRYHQPIKKSVSELGIVSALNLC